MRRKGEPQPADVAVIGAGIAGLTAAALLADQGLRVVVVERDVHPGGCAAGFSKDGYRFAVGATVATGFERGGLHRQVYDRLGLEPRYVEVAPALRVHLPDRVARVTRDRGSWEAELARVFPGQEAAKRAFWRQLAKLADAMYYAATRFPVMPFARWRDLLDTARVAHPGVVPVLLSLRRTVADGLRRHGVDDPAHRAFIDGQLLDAMQADADACVLPNGALALEIYRFGCQYKIGGLETVARDLDQALRARGGQVQYATLAKAILHEDGRVRGLRTSRGEIHAGAVVSAVPLANTAALLEAPAASTLPARAAKQGKMWGAFTLYLGVDARALPEDTHFYEQITGYGALTGGGNVLVSTSPAWDKSRAPEGKRAVTVSTHVDAEAWMAYDKTRHESEKRYMEDCMLSSIEQLWPKLRSGIEVFMSGSPRTFHNFTRRAGGTVGGTPQALGQANFAAASHHSDIRGLFLAGDTVFPGQGTVGVTVSGYNAARSAKRYLTARPSLAFFRPFKETAR